MLDQSQGWHNRIGWGNPSDQALPPPKAETEEPPGCRGHVWRGGGRPLSLPPYPLMDYGGAGEREPTENPNRLTDWPLHTRFIRVGDGWNPSEVQIAQAKPGNGPHRNDQDSCRRSFERELPLMQRQGPATLEGATNRPNNSFTQWIALILFQSTKWEMGEKEREKEVFIEEALHLK